MARAPLVATRRHAPGHRSSAVNARFHSCPFKTKELTAILSAGAISTTRIGIARFSPLSTSIWRAILRPLYS